MSVFTAELRKVLKLQFLPLMAQKGFTVEEQAAPFFCRFRRQTAQGLEICDIQFEKGGLPRFVLNFGQCKDTSRDLAVLDTHDCPVYGRLKPQRGATSKAWFRQDYSFWQQLITGLKAPPAESVVDELTRLFTELEAFWQSGARGHHLDFLRS